MGKVTIIIIIFITSITQVFGAYIFGYLLHNPIPDESSFLLADDPNSDTSNADTSNADSSNLDSQNPTFQGRSFHSESQNLIPGNLNSQNPETQNSEIRNPETEKPETEKPEKAAKVPSQCSSDKDCIGGSFYCDTHYGYCDRVKRVSQLCRRDEQCESGLICLFGRCEIPIPQGSAGSRCTDNRDCADDSCCARQHGEKICKGRLKRGTKCFVPFGGLDYSLNQLCPCQHGLYCTNRRLSKSALTGHHPNNGTNTNTSTSTGISQQKRRIYNHMRCLPKSSN